MALIGCPQIVNNSLRRLLLSPRSCLKASTAYICSKEFRDPTVTKPAPWPYKTKKYTIFHELFDSTVKRFDENTKIIVVDGNIGAGKTAFAKQLAEAFDMVFVPEPNVDNFYITSQGYDLRQLDPIMPPSFKSCDLSTFYKNPYDQNVAMFQYRMFRLRYEQYIDALAHLTSTGQGIVMDRCAFTDVIFMEAMHKNGYLSKPVRDLYIEIYNNCVTELLKPNLIIYLDISSETALERIKKRNDPIEINSKVLNIDYLDSLEYEYKQNYLKKMETHSEILIYDWSNYGDVEVVVEDIERIDFDRYGKYDEKMTDWTKNDDWDWGVLRRKYTSKKYTLLSYLRYFRPSVKEVHPPADEIIKYCDIITEVPGEKYAPGYNTSVGNKWLFKVAPTTYWVHQIMRH